MAAGAGAGQRAGQRAAQVAVEVEAEEVVAAVELAVALTEVALGEIEGEQAVGASPPSTTFMTRKRSS